MATSKLFSGALQPKKKSELQEIANALRISDQGTKEELYNRIRTHLDKHQTTLEDVPTFAGLFSRRKRSAQPQASSSRGGESSDELSRAALSSRRPATLDSIRESTPVNEPAEVSTILKSDVVSPKVAPPHADNRLALQSGSPSRLPPLSTSPTRNLLKAVSRTRVNEIVGAVKKQEENAMQNTIEMILALRSFLSNSRNIWSLTAVFELVYILYNIIPWKTYELPLSRAVTSSLPTVHLVYPTWSVFQTFVFWSVLFHWAIPSLFIPALFGTLISFHPAISSPRPQSSTDRGQRSASIPFDPLTASIVRLTAQIAYPLTAINSKTQVIDIIGFQWRVLSAAAGVAFAFAEAISATSAQFAPRLTPTQQQKSRRKSTSEGIAGMNEG